MAEKFKIQLKGHDGRKHVIDNLDPSVTLGSFQQLVSQKTGIPVSKLSLSVGFPPKEIPDENVSVDITSVGITRGETVLAKDKIESQKKPSVVQGAKWEYPPSIPSNGTMQKKDMPRDNSCLFHAIAYLCHNKKSGPGAAAEMRQLVYNIVASDPQQYNTTFLGAPNAVYRQTIVDPSSWGGAIELSIFSRLFQTEIVAFDYHFLREDVFGEGSDYKKQIFIVYTGDHYDALVYQTTSSEELIVFSTKDVTARQRARDYVFSVHQDAARKGECKPLQEWRKQLPSTRRQIEEKKASFVGGSGVSGSAADNWKCNICTYENSGTSSCGACGARKPAELDAKHSAPTIVTPAPIPLPSFSSSTSSMSSSNVPSSSPSSSSSSSQPFPSSVPTTSQPEFDSKLLREDWSCPACTLKNPGAAERCSVCSEPNPSSFHDSVAPLPPPPTPQPPLIGPDPAMPFSFGALFGPTPGASAAPVMAQPAPARVEWNCAACTFKNTRATPTCTACGTPNPGYTRASSSLTGATAPAVGPLGASATAPVTAQPAGQGFGSFNMGGQPNQYTCQCGTVNPWGLIRCGSCGRPNVYLFSPEQAMNQQQPCTIL